MRLSRLTLIALLVGLLSGCGAMVGGTLYGVLVDDKKRDSNGRPAAAFTQPSVGQSLNDRVNIEYLLIDSESHDSDIVVEYSIAGAAFLPCTPIADYGHDGETALVTSPGGTPHLFVWHSSLDVGDVDHTDVRIRITPTDSRGATGVASDSPSFRLLNQHIATFAGGEVQGDQLIAPAGLFLDEGRNLLYVADNLAAKVYSIDLATLALTRVAGNEFAGFDQDDVLASATSLAEPHALTTIGNSLFVGTSFRVREVSQANGFITTLAGTGVEGTNGDGGVPQNAEIEDEVVGLGSDANGNLYFTDEHRLRIVNREGVDITRVMKPIAAGTIDELAPVAGPEPEAWLRMKLDPAGTVYVVAEEEVWAFDVLGAGVNVYTGGATVTVLANQMDVIIGGGGFDGDGMVATATEFALDERDIAISATTFYVSTQKHRIRAIDRTTGIVSTVGGDGKPQNAGDGGPATAASLHNPRGLALSSTGVLYVACTNAVRAINVSAGPVTVAGLSLLPGEVTTVFSSDPTDFLVASDAIAVTPTGTILTVDATTKALVEIDPITRQRVVIVGPGGDYGGDGGLAVDASSGDYDLVIDGAGNLIFGDEAGRVRAVNRQTMPITIAGVTIQPGQIQTVAGTGDQNAGVGDGGVATAAEFVGPEGIFLDGAGNLYICDENLLRVVNTTTVGTTVNGIPVAPGAIETIAGDGMEGCSGDNGDPLLAEVVPKDVVVDAAGLIYILDKECNGVRLINTTAAVINVWPTAAAPIPVNPGEINTIAGQFMQSGWNGDGLFATDAFLTNPETIFLGDALYICDPGSRRLRRVDFSTGSMTTRVGTGDAGYNGDAIPLLNVRIVPDAVATDINGRFYVLDGNGRIRSFLPTAP